MIGIGSRVNSCAGCVAHQLDRTVLCFAFPGLLVGGVGMVVVLARESSPLARPRLVPLLCTSLGIWWSVTALPYPQEC